MPGGRRWTADDDRKLVAFVEQGKPDEEIAAVLDRSARAVNLRRWHLGSRIRRAPWTPEEENTLMAELEAHRPYRAIAKILGRTECAVRSRASLLGIAARNANGRTVCAVGRLLGMDSHAVAWWIAEGWLVAHGTGLQMGRGEMRVVEHDDLLTFLENSAYWHLWEPCRITNKTLQDWATEIRAGVYYLTTAEAGARLGLTHYAVNSLIRQGRIKARKRGANWLIREEDCIYPEWLPRPKGPPLTDEQRDFVRRWHGKRPDTWIAKRLGCSDQAVYDVVQQLGLPRLGRGYWKRKQRKRQVG